MANESKSRVTQVLKIPDLGRGSAEVSARFDFQIVRLIEQGEETRKIFTAIAEAAFSLDTVAACALYLPSDKLDGQLEAMMSCGPFVVEAGREDDPTFASKSQTHAMVSPAHKTTSGRYNYFDIVCLGAPVGSLVVIAEQALSPGDIDRMYSLAYHAGVVFERHRLSSTLQHFLDRLQVLNELNQLIASNVGLQRIVKSLARESAFRFAADVALTFLFDEERIKLEIKGGYGCAPHLVPAQLDLSTGIIGQVMRTGGHVSLTNLTSNPMHGLQFLEDLGIRAVDVCCLEVRGEALGAILIGYRREHSISQNDLVRFEEFCQGAAVAIANARTQERIQSYTERLEDLVAQRTADLAVQTARAEHANQAKSRFLANMSHELRTPLTAIVGYSSVLADGIFGPMNDKQTDALHAVTRSSEHLKNLIDDVLNLARIESGKENPEPKNVSVKDLLSQTHKLMMQTAVGKGVSIQTLSIPEDIASAQIFADPKHIHQIVINLMSNAVKYTPKGGKVWIETALVGDKLKILVCDTGVGISPEKQIKLFERFERGEDTYSKSQEGTGIGLNLTKHLVELNGGLIGVDSEIGVGSKFWIMMPLAVGEKTQVVVQETATVAARLDGLTAVVVDDNADTCEVLKHILIAAGAQVRIGQSVKDGVALIQDSLPDVILTDLAMPGESGLVLIDYVRNRSREEISRIPIIVLSACAFPGDQQAALDAGASTFIPKPFKPQEVVSTVRQLTLRVALGGA